MFGSFEVDVYLCVLADQLGENFDALAQNQRPEFVNKCYLFL